MFGVGVERVEGVVGSGEIGSGAERWVELRAGHRVGQGVGEWEGEGVGEGG